MIVRDEDGQQVMVHRANTSTDALLEACRVGGVPQRTEVANEEDFDELLARHYQQSGSAEVLADIGEDLDLKELAASVEPEDLMASQDEAPAIRLINAMLTEAVRHNASDVHVEPFEKSLKVRYRLDGVMRELLSLPQTLAPLLTSRIKVMAQLDIAEKRIPQDGRISLRVAGRPVDVRVSTLPSGHGERVVMRLLDKQAGRLDLNRLGMDEGALASLKRILATPHGILLVTGPTGSGKTTSLYAALARLNNQRSTILTVEDPIEYFIEGIGQTQINSKVELDFARGLRAILRQDPDIVMVGEIRDLETAEIAVQASLTGHMVLSTLHTNTAVGAITRLRDMGIEPFLLSSSLVGIVAQRLLRQLCGCKTPRITDAAEMRWLGLEQPATIYQPQACEACNHTGYQGRTGIYEVIAIDSEMRRLIHDGASELDLERLARTLSPGIRDSGRRKVLNGETSLSELLRIVQEH